MQDWTVGGTVSFPFGFAAPYRITSVDEHSVTYWHTLDGAYATETKQDLENAGAVYTPDLVAEEARVNSEFSRILLANGMTGWQQ